MVFFASSIVYSKRKMSNVQVCDFADGLVDEVRKFRFNKAKCSRAIIMKIDIAKQKLVIEDTLEDVDAETLQNELPERQPRFILYSFELNHGDGRISYPMCLIWSTPIGCKTDLQMMYAGTKLPLVKEAVLIASVIIDLNDFIQCDKK